MEWVENIANSPEELEQRVNSILGSDPSLSFGETESKDFSGKDLARDKEWEAALVDSLLAARGYDTFGPDYDLERAYCLDRASKCMAKIAEMDVSYGRIHRVCAETRETAAELFEKAGGNHIVDAKFAFLRAARSYVNAKDLKKAAAAVKKTADSTASLKAKQAFKIANILEKIGDLAYQVFKSESLPPECHLLYAETKETAADIFMGMSFGESVYYEEAGFAFLRSAAAFSAAGNAEKAMELLGKSDSAFGYVGHSTAALFVRGELFPEHPIPANKP